MRALAGKRTRAPVALAQMNRRALFTVPNTVSLSRLVLAFAFVLVTDTRDRVALIVTAGFTDFLDGWIARKGNSQTTSGALIDPFADRVFVLSAVSAYLVHDILSTTQYFIFLSRDLATAVGFLVAKLVPRLKPVEFKARMLGKIVTVMQLGALLAVILIPQYKDPLVWLIGLVSVASIVDYTLALWRARVR
jgi:CDP-diacylglycerol--glycerol-3-phosphate 3-phosphatidyltransferase